MILNLISGPRNISTALMYSFAQRSDTKVVDEPFYAHYLIQTGLDHPGRKEIIESMAADANEVLDEINRLAKSYDILFLKNMSHHHEGLDWSYLKDMINVFLIRNPRQLIASFSQVIPNPTLQDIGLKHEAQLLDYVIDHGNHAPIVIDSNGILPDPQSGLEELCGKIGIPFEPQMLSWKAGPIVEDGIWAKYWYKNVHQSTGFAKQKTSERPLPDHCKPLYLEALPYYEKLKSYI
ncbi:MAG: sulfotransferase family protein [Ekhidna sp.]|uniref:sulfotransferase-like domain-containing protein n=1 Tax=Ekhidna sp. TaxID=2608089 RepID=UPI0032EAAB61